MEECEAAHASCDAVPCEATGGQWFSEAVGGCGFACGAPAEMDCLAPMAACRCASGKTFERGEGCRPDPACGMKELCLATRGTFFPAAGPDCYCSFMCGSPTRCAGCNDACNCGPHRNYVEGQGCVVDDGCGGATVEGKCASTGGTWHPDGGCGDYACGNPNTAEPCVMPGCDCGRIASFDAGQGCVPDEACTDRAVGAACWGSGEDSNCRAGLVCCPVGGPMGSGWTCRDPCCATSEICMDGGCPVPPP